MTKQVQLANSLLWASAIVASAVFQAPAALTLLRSAVSRCSRMGGYTRPLQQQSPIQSRKGEPK